tara:strand:+ start:234 stop:539 length:306 start_codon:yes stop_codon:yes gene_type:complete
MLTIYHDPEIYNLYEKYKEKYPKSNSKHFSMLGDCGFYGLYMSEAEIIEVLKKCLRENLIFQVWEIKWKEYKIDEKGEEIFDPMPMDWWEGKLVYKKHKPC